MSTGPIVKEGDSIRMRQLVFTARLPRDTVEIDGQVQFLTQSAVHFLDFYLPYMIRSSTGEIGSETLTPQVHADRIDMKSSMLHAEIAENSTGGWENFSFVIHTEKLVAVSQLGQDRLILTFGNAESSKRLRSLDEYRGKNPVDMMNLTPLTVTAVADEHQFFSSDCYPTPDVEFLHGGDRIATWWMNFSGPLSNYYRSIDCTLVDPSYIQSRELLIFASGAVFSVGVKMTIDSCLEAPTTRWLLIYLRVRHKILQALSKLR